MEKILTVCSCILLLYTCIRIINAETTNGSDFKHKKQLIIIFAASMAGILLSWGSKLLPQIDPHCKDAIAITELVATFSVVWILLFFFIYQYATENLLQVKKILRMPIILLCILVLALTGFMIFSM